MTNEQLAEAIQRGRSELIPQLWDNVYRLIYYHCDRLYILYKERLTACGVEAWDLKQESYIAFLAAIRAFKADSGYKFNTYLPYHIKTVIRRLIKKDMLNRCESLDRPIIQSESGDELALSEVVPDEQAEQPFDDIETADIYRGLHEAVNNLPAEQRHIIRDFYFSGKTVQEIAEGYNTTSEYVKKLKKKALNELIKPENLHLFKVSDRQYNSILKRGGINIHHKGLESYKSSLTSEIEDYIERRQR